MAIVDDLFLESFPFSCCLFFSDGASLTSGGALFPAPSEALDKTQIEFYKNAHDGWSICPLGYAVYSFTLVPERGDRLVVFGLKVKNVSTIQGKTNGLSIKTNQSEIENLAKLTANSVRSIEDRLQSIVSSGVHEFRNVNKDLYNAAYFLEQQLTQIGGIRNDLLEKSKSIVQLSEMIKSRSDIFDVITNPSIAKIQDQNIHVYKAFDRARKSIISASSSRNMKLSISGSSNNKALAVQMFDVVPYILLQNAVKYSPDNCEIDIVINEDDKFIYVLVSSFGPGLKSEELEKVFNPGFRGASAMSFESQGSGMGLFVAKRLIEFCGGATIVFSQDDTDLLLQNISFRRTQVKLTLAKALS